MDTGQTPFEPRCAYASYTISNTTTAAIADVWVQIGPFSLPANMGVSQLGSNTSHLGSLPALSSKTAYFYICGTVTGNAVSITYTVAAYPSPPPVAAFAGGTKTFTFVPWSGKGAVQDAGQAASNKVNAIMSGPNPPTLGGYVSLTVTGSTGTIGGANLIIFSPATGWDWPANTLQLISSKVQIDLPSIHFYNDVLAVTITYTSNTTYTASYLFRATASTVTGTTATPVNYISSGANMQHTRLDQGAYAGGTGNIQAISPPQNGVVLSITSTSSVVQYPAAVSVTVHISNTGTASVNLDGFKLAVPSSPGSASVVSGTSVFGGTVIPDPLSSSGQILWSGIYTVPAGSSLNFTYYLLYPPNTGYYYLSQTAIIGSTQIDTTLSTTDDAPANISGTVTVPMSLTATAGASGTVYPGAVSVTVRVSNSGAGAIALDSLQLAVPTSPGQPAAVTGTSTFNGGAISDPVASSGLITWSGIFSIPAGAFRDFFYYLNFPASAGFYFVSQTAAISTGVIDMTQDTGVSSPASFGITVVMPTATPTSTSTPTPTFTATPSPSFTTTSTSTPSMTASPSVTLTLTPVACHVMISAITSHGSSANDWLVQLYYSCGSGACLDISGWKIRDRGPGCASVTDLFTFPASSIIKPNGYILLATGSYLPVSYGAGSQAADYTTLAIFGSTGRAIELWNGTYAEDLVGINSSICAEGASVGAINSAQIARRNPAGADTDVNNVDFTVSGIAAVTLLGGGNVCVPTPTFTQSPTGTPTPTRTASPTSTATPSATPTESPTATPTASPTATPSPSTTPTGTPSASPTASGTSSASPTATPTESPTATASPTASPSASPTGTPTHSPTATASGTATASATGTGTATHTPTQTQSPTFSTTESFTSGPSPSNSTTSTSTGTPTGTPTATTTPTSSTSPTFTASSTATDTPSSSATPTASSTATATQTSTQTQSPTFSNTGTSTTTATPSSSVTPTPSSTPTATSSSTASPSNTPTATETPTASPTLTVSETATVSPSVTLTATSTASPNGTLTNTPTASASPTDTESPTSTPSSSATPTETPSSSATGTETPTASVTETATASASPSSTESPTGTPSPSSTPSETPSSSATGTETPSASPTETATSTASPTASPSETPTASPTGTPTASSTATPTDGNTDTPTPSLTETPSGTSTATAAFSSTATPTFSASPTCTTVSTSFPTPVFSSVSQSGSSSGGGFTITVSGSGFLPGAEIWVDGQRLVTVYIDANTLVATADAHSPGSFNVQVSNQGPVFAALSGTVSFVGPAENLVLAPMPAKRGQPICLFSAEPLADSQWTIFGADQQVVARLSSSDAKACFTRSGDLVPGVYIVRIRTRDRSGRSATVVRNLVLEP